MNINLDARSLPRDEPANPFGALERYPVSLGACPYCDSPYGTVHGPDCPYDPEPGESTATANGWSA